VHAKMASITTLAFVLHARIIAQSVYQIMFAQYAKNLLVYTRLILHIRLASRAVQARQF